jgi:16S rRNA (adenine1518-N6/adenine1519-N6)-dimethyltransferase
MSSYETRDIIKKFNIKMTKSLGQNFLINDAVIEDIVDASDITKNDTVIEIGPGIGNMTRLLAQRANKVIAVEIDRYLIPALKFYLRDFNNIEILNEDILKADLNGLISREKAAGSVIKVVANLPYYITTPVIMRFLEETSGVSSMVFMMHKEVANRILAKPGGKDYGAITVAARYYSVSQRLFDVAPDNFIPQPGVDSTVIRMNTVESPPVQLVDKAIFFRTVKAAFNQRRKTLQNALANSGYFSRSKVAGRHP